MASQTSMEINMKKSIAVLWIIKKIKQRIPLVLMLTISTIGQSFFGVIFALGTKRVIDCAITGAQNDFFSACIWQGAIIVGILLCMTISRHLRARLQADLDRDWKKDLLHSLLRGEYKEVSKYHSGELINRLNNDVRIVNDGILTIVPSLAGLFTKMVSAMTVLLALEPKFSLGIFAVGVIVIVITACMRGQLKVLHKKVSEQDGIVSGFLQEILEKILMVQAMDAAAEMEYRAEILMEQRYEMQKKRKNVSLFANTSVSVMYYLVGFVTLIWCAGKLLQGQMSFGSLTAVTQLVNQLQTPFTSISGIIPQYIAVTASAERLMELECIPQNQDEVLEDIQNLYENLESIQGKNVTFSYDRDTILEEASFYIPKGRFAVITGPSGIGKSTLLKLFLGIFSKETGELFLQCENKRVSLNRGTRRMFAYVPQGNLLLSGTLRENLTVVRPNATDKEIAQAAYVSAMDEYVEQLPLGLDTVIGENGVGLSEGQAQRLAIARAILGGAPILLLDECTSALDHETERIVLQRLKELTNRMCIVVTHRPAALEISDFQLHVHEMKITCEEKK